MDFTGFKRLLDLTTEKVNIWKKNYSGTRCYLFIEKSRLEYGLVDQYIYRKMLYNMFPQEYYWYDILSINLPFMPNIPSYIDDNEL